MTEAERIIKILQVLGCKIKFTENGIEFSAKDLISPYLLNRIEINEEEIREILDKDLTAASLNFNCEGSAGCELKKIIPTEWLELSEINNILDQMDARGHTWCYKNKNMLLEKFHQIAHRNELEFDMRKAKIILTKAISNAKKRTLTF